VLFPLLVQTFRHFCKEKRKKKEKGKKKEEEMSDGTGNMVPPSLQGCALMSV